MSTPVKLSEKPLPNSFTTTKRNQRRNISAVGINDFISERMMPHLPGEIPDVGVQNTVITLNKNDRSHLDDYL